LVEDERFVYGVEPDVSDASAERADASGATIEVAIQEKSETNTELQVDRELPNYVDRVPMEVNDMLLREGRTQFNIHCAVCHGKAGYGNGLASQRALELEQGTWVPPTSLHSPHLFEQPDGQLFNSITNGVRKMPAYGHQIAPRERWAIVAYIRALQRSQQTTIDDVPEDYRPTLREFN
jgi:cytochrome c